MPLMTSGFVSELASASTELIRGLISIWPTAAKKLFFSAVDACSNRRGMRSSSELSDDNDLSRALVTTSAVILPSAAIWRIWPLVTPKYSASARVMRGPCSMTEFSSSPRSVPEARPCES
ncbi:hypothetical protein D3C86_1039690 [compost metagenome]